MEGLFNIIVAIPTILIIFFQISTKTLWYHFSCPPGSQNNEVQQVRELVDKATNIVMNYTETEAKVSKILWFVRLIPLNLKGS